MNRIVLGALAALLLFASTIGALAQNSNRLGRAFERQLEQQMVLDTGKWDRLDTLYSAVNEEAKSDPLIPHEPKR